VHPLLFAVGGREISVDPRRIPLQLALKLLSAEHWTTRARRDLAATVLMIVSSNPDVRSTDFDRIDAGVIRLDEQLLEDLHARCPRELKVALFESAAVFRLSASAFKRLFHTTWSEPMLSAGQRHILARSLSARLRPRRRGQHVHLQVDGVDDYRDVIIELLWSPGRSLCLRGLLLAGLLNDLSPRDLGRMKRKLTSRWFDHRMNACNGLCELVKRHRELPRAIIESATSLEVRKAAARITRTDPEAGARSCAYFLLKAIREYDASRAR
jgi:hypothetical protein